MSEKKEESQEEKLMKQAFKEAFIEFLDSKFAEFGRFSIKTVSALIIGAVAYFVLTMNGWHK